jgi:hypothetical protein
VTPPRRLAVGELVLFDGSPHRVERVSFCSASLVPVYTTPKTVTIRDKRGDLVRTFEAHSGGTRVQVSPFSFVERIAE